MSTRKKFYLILLKIVATIALSACDNRYPLDRVDFIATMEAEGFEIFDVSYYIDFADYVILAVPPSDEYQIEFYEFATDDDASSSFEATRQLIEDGSESSQRINSVNVANYNRFTITSGGKYAHLYRVGNTMILVDWTDSEHQDEISDLLYDFEN